MLQTMTDKNTEQFIDNLRKQLKKDKSLMGTFHYEMAIRKTIAERYPQPPPSQYISGSKTLTFNEQYFKSWGDPK